VDRIVDDFHLAYRDSKVSERTYWLGVQTLKGPLDLWVYQEILHRTRPDLIVETGTWSGGSALYLATICDLLGGGEVVSIDVAERERPEHPRITYLTGSSVDPEIIETVRGRAAGRTMVLLDSDHSEDHVLAELRAYADLVTPGCYLIVEDTAADQLSERFGPGPHAAVEEFLASDERFERDPDCEKFFFTFQPGGWLRRR
jgi:cephalosporin hydroxylase